MSTQATEIANAQEHTLDALIQTNPSAKDNLRNHIQGMLSVIVPALEIQIILALGFLITFFVSIFYYVVGDSRYVTEKPSHALIAIAVSMGCFLLGKLLRKIFTIKNSVDLKHGAFIILWVWIFACSISSMYFMLSGFPIPESAENFSLVRKFIDGFYESMSGFTTTGTSILPSVEVFPRSVIFWRSLTHWIGGMGIAFMAVTLWRGFKTRRSEIINSEAESPHIVVYKSEQDAITSGKDFLKIYGTLSIICLVLLLISGALFRVTPYEAWYDNAFDASTMMFGTMGTGGFGVYDTSVGLMKTLPDGSKIIGGLQNPTSEWIIAFFMAFSAMNMVLWFFAFFKKKPGAMFRNMEFRAFWAFVIFSTLSIWGVLMSTGHAGTLWDNLRYAFFSVTTIVSTTGYANVDFAVWPAAAVGILFLSYLVGGSVGSTGGGLKFLRFVVLYKYCKQQLQNLIHNQNQSSFVVDGVKYDVRSAGLIITNIVIYFLIFFAGAVLLLVTSSVLHFSSGEIATLNVETAFTTSIANLGNIGPALVNGIANDGPTGNYSAFSEVGKSIMAVLMFIGRVGVLTVVMFFIKRISERDIKNAHIEVDFDSDSPLILK